MLPPVKKTKYRFLALIGFLAIAGAVYACFFSPLLSIKNIRSEGANYDKEKIRDLISKRRVLLGLIPSNNLMLVGKNWFSELQTPDIKNFSIKKNYAQKTLDLYFEPRKEILSWCVPKTDYELRTTDYGALTPTPDSETAPTSTPTIEWQCFYTDKDGVLFKKSSFIESPHFIQIKDLTGRPLALGDSIDSKIIDFAQKIFLSAKNKNLNVSQFEIKNYESKEIVGDSESFKIFFALEKDPTRQIENLFTVLEQEIKEDKSRLLYIDLRNDNKVFFKYK